MVRRITSEGVIVELNRFNLRSAAGIAANIMQ
jgi:hypothetical protein